MTNAEKQLLLKDLCARLPYGVICKLSAKGANASITEILGIGGLEHFIFGTMDVKPYLRPMSSITVEERDEVKKHMKREQIVNVGFYHATEKTYDWYNAHHFDYRGLIEKGLALEAHEDMYKTE